MNSELETLSISRDELNEITGLEVSSIFMGGTIRPSVFRSQRRLISLLVTEVLAIGVLFTMGLGLALVLVRQRENFEQLGSLLLVVAGCLGVGAIAWHSYQWHRCKILGTLAHLLDEVDRHNDIIQALRVMDQLEAAQSRSPGLPQRPEIIQALQATRQSLLSALVTEKILRHHRSLVNRRQELFTAIETNLAILQTLQVNHQASEYQHFLQEALEIGLAVQQEITHRKTTH